VFVFSLEIKLVRKCIENLHTFEDLPTRFPYSRVGYVSNNFLL